MNCALIERIIYIGIQVVFYAGIGILLVISACVFVHYIATHGWSDEVREPRSWRKSDKVMAEKWGDEWDKLKKLKERRK